MLRALQLQNARLEPSVADCHRAALCRCPDCFLPAIPCWFPFRIPFEIVDGCCRTARIHRTLDNENARLRPKGLQWIELVQWRSPPSSRVLVWSPVRPFYEAAHPEERRVTQEAQCFGRYRRTAENQLWADRDAKVAAAKEQQMHEKRQAESFAAQSVLMQAVVSTALAQERLQSPPQQSMEQTSTSSPGNITSGQVIIPVYASPVAVMIASPSYHHQQQQQQQQQQPPAYESTGASIMSGNSPEGQPHTIFVKAAPKFCGECAAPVPQNATGKFCQQCAAPLPQ